MAIVVIQRADTKPLQKKKVDVVVDGKRVATISNGETVSLPVTEGRHKVNVAVDFFVGRKLVLEAVQGNTYQYKVTPSKTYRLTIPIVICIFLLAGIPEKVIPLWLDISLMLALAIPVFIWKMITRDAYFMLTPETGIAKKSS